MSKQKHFGKCALCGKEGKLSFEHIPPESAFNDQPAKTVSFMTALSNKDRLPWDFNGLKYTNHQRGMGDYTLCESCNNNTGSWYGEAYTYIASIAQQMLSMTIPPDKDSLVIKDAYPLRFVKQIISMFCSLNPTSNIADLRQFVLDKNATGIDKTKYRLHMFFTRSTISRTVPYIVKVLSSDRILCSMGVSEIVVPPLGFILYFDPTEDYCFDGVDITGFADCKYDDKAKIAIPLCILDVNHFFPTDYRTKDEILRVRKENEEKNIRNGSDENI